MYLIQNSELFGLSRKDILLVALTARYHRRASPKAVHAEYASLDREVTAAPGSHSVAARSTNSRDLGSHHSADLFWWSDGVAYDLGSF
jgi:exopolyphosphatase/guanosine-5'-triphosphate,3'-diphosphate pyrophosphatase